MNWKTQELIEKIEETIKSCEETIKVFQYEQSQYKHVFETDDKFEAKSHEYWRARVRALKDEIADLRELIEFIGELEMEEVKESTLALEDDQENRHNSSLGI